MTDEPRSGCPINLSLEVIGDRWSLIVLRDIIFGGKRHFNDLVRRSEEGITPKTLTDRLARLEAAGLVTRSPDPEHKQRSIISLTEAGIALLPVLVALTNFGLEHLPVAPRFLGRSRAIRAGGDAFITAFTAELRAEHLGAPAPPHKPTIRARLTEAAKLTDVAEADSFPYDSRKTSRGDHDD